MRAKRILGGVGAALAAAAVAVGATWLVVGAGVLARLGAKTVCTCVFVSERPEEVCAGEELALQGIGFVRATVDRPGRRVEARALRVGSGRAAFREGRGCTLE